MDYQLAGSDRLCGEGDLNCTYGESLGTGDYNSQYMPPYPRWRGPGQPFPTADVPDHAHYIIGTVILLVGITGILGNALVMYVFCRSRSLRTPGNMFVVNLAVADLLMSLTQAPVFFVASMHRRWVFGERACELYAFCGALFGICSMMTLTAIAVDRCVAITQPLAFLCQVSRRRVGVVLLVVWLYSLGWSLPPFFGWSAYVPEGLQTSCSWDYMSFTSSVRAYTILLFTFVFFIPLGIIGGCYSAIFRAIRIARKEIKDITCGQASKVFERMQSEWRMAKVALLVISLFVLSWSPYSVVALTATAGYSHLLTPYMNSVPAVIAKASAIHNPIIYAITHPKYRVAIARHVPILRRLLRVGEKDLRLSFSSSSGASSRRPTLSSQCSLGMGAVVGPTNTSKPSGRWAKTRLSSASDTDSCWTESEADANSVSSLTTDRRVSTEISPDTAVPVLPQHLAAMTQKALMSDRVNNQSTSLNTSGLTDGTDTPAVADGKAFLLSADQMC